MTAAGSRKRESIIIFRLEKSLPTSTPKSELLFCVMINETAVLLKDRV